MPRSKHKLPLKFTDYRMFGLTEDFVKYALNIGWTIHRNEVVASQLVIAAFLYLQSRVAQLEGRSRKMVSRATKIFLDHPQMVQKLVFELSERHEIAQEEAQNCDVSSLLIRYIKDLVSFYMEHNSYYVVVGQTRYFLDYARRHLEILDREVASDLMRGGDKQMARAQKLIYEELERRFKEQLKKSADGRRKYAFELLKNPDQYADLVREALSRFNLWISPPDLQQSRISRSAHKQMGQAEADRYHTLLDFDALIDLTRRLSLPNPKSCWALPQFCMVSSENPPPDLDPPTWTDKELKAIEDTITATLTRRQSASAQRLLILVDGKEQHNYSPVNTKTITFNLNKGERLIEVISCEPNGDIPLAAYLMDYDDESYVKKWGFFGERLLKSTVILEGGQKVSFIVSLTKNAEQEVIDASVTVSFHSRGLLGRAAQWWEDFQSRNWSQLTLLNPIQALALCLGATVCLTGYGLYLRWKPSADSKMAKQGPERPKTENERPVEPPQPPLLPTPRINQNRVVASSTPKPKSTSLNSTTQRKIPDDLETIAVGKDGAVRLSDQTVLPASLSRSTRELVETGSATPTEEARLALAAIDDLTRDAQRRAQGAENSLPLLVSPALTAIRSRNPTLRWKPVPGAQEYQVRVAYPPDREDGTVVWEGRAGPRTQVTLPVGVLRAGEVYLWQVETNVQGRSRVSPEAGFWVLDADSSRKVAAAERRYGKSTLPRISVYEAYGLYEEALSQVERLAKMNPTSSRARLMLTQLRRQLGKE